MVERDLAQVMRGKTRVRRRVTGGADVVKNFAALVVRNESRIQLHARLENRRYANRQRL